MKEVDQETGEDLNPTITSGDNNFNLSLLNGESPWMNPENELNGSENVSSVSSNKRTRPRLSTPERWELRQMQGGGAISNMDLPDFDPELGVLKNFDGYYFFKWH